MYLNIDCYRDRAVGISRHNFFLWAHMKCEVYKRKVDYIRLAVRSHFRCSCLREEKRRSTQTTSDFRTRL